LVEAAGCRPLVVSVDLTERDSVVRAAERVLSEWGEVDLLVNNGRYVGPGHMDRFLDTPIGLLDRQVEANVMAPIMLTRMVLPSMLEAGRGYIINITSDAADGPPSKVAGEGGWGVGYAISKGALHRLAGMLALELGALGIKAYNILPGFVATERTAGELARYGIDVSLGAGAESIGEVVVWLVSNPSAAEPNGRTVSAQEVYKCITRP
jgi:NAD(P)-dependent dehydrogenase (short-subunit alcohol dehydrogenase family)